MTQADARLLQRGLLLEYLTLGWNVVGTVIVVVAAVAAGSVALAGFGLNSLIEICASLVVWQLKGIHQNRERPALRLIGAAFLLPAAYVLVQSARTVLAAARPASSPAGIAWLAATLWSSSSTGSRKDGPRGRVRTEGLEL